METTKEKILAVALEHFSKKGYEGTLLREIASDLNLSKSALYKHYESKEDIWNSLCDSMEVYYSEKVGSRESIEIPTSFEEFRKSTMERISVTIHNERIKSVRKLLAIEQFRNDKMKALADKHFIESIEGMYTAIFSGMMENGLLKKDNPQLLAFEFSAPITLLIHLCDREPEKEAEAMKKIEAHVNHFIEQNKKR